ncbi:MAG: ATP-binding cassette domain-containing protein [Proteobacteria bacterium TMED51]|nr:MAG: ABC transporter ATP-binding protein [Candidatus Thioglobus sp. MED-G23]RPG00357.1 MAG: ATP-binding cassette domain-containing protein [Proteobacteria bacterium TMED51]HBP85942.1 ABC transporter ATP-binding protein [Gammaproteobacteria bacterium]|tara:strand:- start:362 stop:2269 length:1908 start_codon:yes stop_codon:yes gene_type:complete
MFLIRLDDVSLAFGPRKLLRGAELSIEPAERVCLVGRNGAGKTSVLRLLTGTQEPDEGEVRRHGDLCITELEQVLPGDEDQRVGEFVAEGLTDIIQMTEQYREQAGADLDAAGLKALQDLHSHIDAHGGWHPQQQVESICTEMGLDPEQPLKALSGGWRRRAALARSLAPRPDLLLLDEPTNHLDFEAISWLESRLAAFSGAVLFITHDRAFLQRLATRIVEIDRGKLRSWPGDYADFLRRRAEALAAERQANSEFDRKLAEEEVWIRQGIKARRTRNEGRVRALEAMREVRVQRVNPDARARVHIEESDQSGRKVLDARGLSFGYGDSILIQDFSLRIRRGDRIGLVGNNGVGKSTLLRLLLGEIEPKAGSIKWGVNIQLGYFDQHRRELDPDKTVAQIVGDGREYVTLNGKPRHVVGYLRGFLFSAKRALTPVRALSGGERNRVILARLFTQPANFLILDEPTNDLDVETLEVLEEKLTEYAGTLMVVSHDRAFLDNTVTSILAFEADGAIRPYVGNYSDWMTRGQSLASGEAKRPRGGPIDSDPSRPTRPASARKLSYKLQRELDDLPGVIESVETQLGKVRNQTLDSDFYQRNYSDTQPVLDQLADLERELEQHLQRWSELEEMNARLKSK